MCGFTVFLAAAAAQQFNAVLFNMANAIAMRGPDDAGYWSDVDAGVVIAHRRLAVVDLSPAGHQPMPSASGRYVIAFNGEIYNHLRLRQELLATAWRGHSDTETLLAGFDAWGIEATLKKCVGMFAFAVWDKQTKTLTLARDRMGEKPLYWGWQNGVLLFGSELKALKAHPAFDAEIDRNALALLLRHGYIPAPHSIYRGIQKLQPGHFISIPVTAGAAAEHAKPVAYWRMNDVIAAGQANPFRGSDAEATDLLEDQLCASIRGQMLADVPLGAFLSGGIDSSTIVALMQKQSAQPVRTFTIGFDEKGYDEEATHAKAVAQHLATDHTELYVRSQDAMAVIPRLADIYCEPFADSSQIPTFLVSQMARQHVTVALSGDAGDELFGGYNPYQFAPRIWNLLARLPLPFRKLAASALSRVPVSEQLKKLLEVLDAPNREAFYRQLVSHWKAPEEIVLGAHEPATLLNTPGAWPQVDSFQHWMMAMDAQTYMPDDILVKVDRAAMANSLETRVPMLDHRVVELAWRMPLNLKIRDGKGKWLLREVLYRHVPREMIERPKKGFSIPLAAWLRGPLRDWAEALLNESRLRQEGYFNPTPVRRVWLEHIAGQRDNSTKLWSILMFQAWLEKQSAPGSA
jgi:asparagine synthase (glutamine-hydrolysing)